MQILNNKQVRQKIRRLAMEIMERNFDEESIILAGINTRGYQFAEMLMEEMKGIAETELELTNIKINPAAPLSNTIEMGIPLDELENKSLIIVDDVANTGRTMFYAFQPLMGILPRKVEVAVLVDRKHKAFPVTSNYVGLSLATTLNDNIDVRISENREVTVFLD